MDNICIKVTKNGVTVYQSSDSGIKPILTAYDLGLLGGADVYDKIVGYAGAALMVTAVVASVNADVISSDAVKLFTERAIPFKFVQEVPHILNRTETDLCPMERASLGAAPHEVAARLKKVLGILN